MKIVAKIYYLLNKKKITENIKYWEKERGNILELEKKLEDNPGENTLARSISAGKERMQINDHLNRLYSIVREAGYKVSTGGGAS